MRLKVELTYWNGILEEGSMESHGPEVSLIDCDTGAVLSEGEFATYETMEAAIAERYPGCERWVPPPAPPEEAAALVRVLDLLDAGTELSRSVIRGLLIRHIVQCSHSEEITARIRKAWAVVSAESPRHL